MEAVQTVKDLGEQIRRFRVQRRLDQTELAERIGLDRSAVSKIESGTRRVTALELVRIAQALDVHVPDLMFLPPEPVRAARATVGSFHDTATDTEAALFEAQVQLDRLLRDAEQLRSSGHLRPGVTIAPTNWGTDDDAVQLAAHAREALGIGDQPLGALVEVCAHFGLWLCPLELPVDGLSATPEPGFGVAVIAAGDPGRRRATAAHELGHHLSGDNYSSDASIPHSQADRERLIERFTAEFLLPRSAARRRLVDIPVEERRDALVALCTDYRVSWSLGRAVCVDTGLELPPSVSGNPTDEDFLRVAGAKPEEDLAPGRMARAWVKAAYRAADDALITRRRAAEICRQSGPTLP